MSKNHMLNSQVDFYYRKLIRYASEGGGNDSVINKIREFDRYRENFWDAQQTKYNVKYMYLIPNWEKLELEIVKKHKELFDWLKIWWSVCGHTLSNQHMYETAYAYLVDEGCFGYVSRWKELK